MGCYVWCSDEGTGRGPSPPRPLIAAPNVTAHPSTASVPITVLLYNGPLLCCFNVPIKGLNAATANAVHNSTVTHCCPLQCAAVVELLLFTVYPLCSAIIDDLFNKQSTFNRYSFNIPLQTVTLGRLYIMTDISDSEYTAGTENSAITGTNRYY